MCRDERALDCASMLTDPLIRLVMDSDGVTVAEMAALLASTQTAVVARQTRTFSQIRFAGDLARRIQTVARA